MLPFPVFRILLVLATSIVVDRVVKYGSYVVFWVVLLEEMVVLNIYCHCMAQPTKPVGRAYGC